MMGDIAKRKDFDSIFLGGRNGPLAIGRFKLSEAGIGWKNGLTGQIITVPAADIQKLHWIRVSRDFELRITKKDSTVFKFDGFPRDSFDGLNSIVKGYYGVSLEQKEMSLKGQNWGQAEFSGNMLQFSTANKLAFELPLSDVSNTSVGGKNEVSIEFATPGPLNPSEPNARVREDSMVEIRFYVPGNVTAGQIDEGSDGKRAFKDKKDEVEVLQDGKEEGEIDLDSQEVVYGEDGEALTAAAMLCETIKQKSDYGSMTSETIVSFTEILCLTPRGRFKVDMYDGFLRLRGKSHDYKIMYSNIKRLFLLPKPDDLHFHFVMGLEPPLRQGQTRYPYLVFQFEREDEVELDVNLSADDLKEKYEGKLQQKYDGPVYDVVSEIFQGLSGKKVVGPSGNFKSSLGHASVKCSLKANEAILYPLEKSFLSIPKPPVYFHFNEIAAVSFSRVAAGSSTSTKTFEVKFNLTSGVEYSFSSIPREEYGNLEAFCRAKKLPVSSVDEGEVGNYRGLSDDEDTGTDTRDGKRRRTAPTGAGALDAEDAFATESEDEDFIAGHSGSESSASESDSDSDAEGGSDGGDDD